ncbi:MAG: hypothetical protein COB36_10985 [Alphaproteobacteria bacterium]|nr:MAG: hypothetical protein COB36_10985 [Alphaproteobacteria bacterium]
MLLTTIVEKAKRYGLEDYAASAINAVDGVLPPATIGYLEELDSELDEVISEITAIPTEEEIADRNPPLCEGCEE